MGGGCECSELLFHFHVAWNSPLHPPPNFIPSEASGHVLRSKEGVIWADDGWRPVC